MTWPMDVLKIELEEQLLHDKAFNIAKNPKYDGYQRGLFSMVYNFLIKKLLVVVLKMRIFQAKNYLKNYINQLLENLRKEKDARLLQTIFGLLILLICN